MKKLILILFILSGFISRGQDAIYYPDSSALCKAGFYSYVIDTDMVKEEINVQFYNFSFGENLKYSWDFDNGYLSNEFEPLATFESNTEDRKVCLTVSNENCQDVYCSTFSLNPVIIPYHGDSISYDCFIDFSYYADPDSQISDESLKVKFYTKSNEEIAKYLWDFGDGTTSNEPTPTHIFNVPPISDSLLGFPNPFVDVCLTVTTVSGCESVFCQPINVYMNTWPEESACNAWFKYDDPGDIVTIPEVKPYKFFANSEYEIVSWYWDFGDGRTSYDPEPVVTFDIFRYTQNVCLTILTADSCSSTVCQDVYISPWVVDTVVYVDPVCNYKFEYDSYFPPTASACLGTVTAKVVLGEQKIDTEYFYWSDGTEGPTIEKLCPTNTYTVTALTIDGCKFSGSFIFNSDGTVTEVPVDWWIYHYEDDPYISYNLNDSSYSAEWVMCDGTIVTGDSIPVNKYNCPENKATLIIRDSEGNMVYNETVDLGATTSKKDLQNNEMSMYPIPVKDVLNIRLKEESDNLKLEIINMQGRVVQRHSFKNKSINNQLNIDVSSLPKGTYLLKAISANKVLSIGKFNK